MQATVKHDDIPPHLQADPVEPEVVWERGSLGSPVLALRGGHPEALRCLADLYARRFRKGWRDLKAGIAVFMAPAMSHETTARDAGDLVLALCSALDLPVAALRATTLRGTADGGARRGDPDDSFFIGETAKQYLAARRADGVAAADALFEGTPADLAVEVEHTHHDAAKQTIYRDAGVSELWEIATPGAGGLPTIVDLRARGGPRSVDASRLIPGVRADGIKAALDVLREIGGYGDFREFKGRGEPVARRLLDAARRAPRTSGHPKPPRPRDP